MPWAATGMSTRSTSAALEMPISRVIDRDGALVDVVLNDDRKLAATKAFLRSAKTVMGLAPDRITTDGHHAYPRVIRTALYKRVRHWTSRHLSNCHEQGPTSTNTAFKST
jgi:transposase-like protein